MLDVDGRRGATWLRRYAAEHGIRLAGPLAQSGSGGWHYYFAATGRACPPLRDPASGEAIAQVDWRGNGGVIVAPPSRHASGQSYRWVRDLDTPLPEVPAPLRTLLEPSAGRAARPTAPAPARAAGRNHPYARSALEGECARVAGTPLGSGRRNKTLYAASLRLHSYVAGGLLDEGEVQRRLLEAARVCGLPQREASATIRSAATVARVKGVPERPPPPPQRRHPGRDPPQAKETRARWRRADRERDSIP